MQKQLCALCENNYVNYVVKKQPVKNLCGKNQKFR